MTRGENPPCHDPIRAFGARTGIPVFPDTSFNENEPIVEHPADAADCFMRTKMDVPVPGPCICRKDDR